MKRRMTGPLMLVLHRFVRVLRLFSIFTISASLWLGFEGRASADLLTNTTQDVPTWVDIVEVRTIYDSFTNTTSTTTTSFARTGASAGFFTVFDGYSVQNRNGILDEAIVYFAGTAGPVALNVTSASYLFGVVALNVFA